jgi:hypothetical protein
MTRCPACSSPKVRRSDWTPNGGGRAPGLPLGVHRRRRTCKRRRRYTRTRSDSRAISEAEAADESWCVCQPLKELGGLKPERGSLPIDEVPCRMSSAPAPSGPRWRSGPCCVASMEGTSSSGHRWQTTGPHGSCVGPCFPQERVAVGGPLTTPLPVALPLAAACRLDLRSASATSWGFGSDLISPVQRNR